MSKQEAQETEAMGKYRRKGLVLPAELEAHRPDYYEGAWQDFALAELGWWVHLLAMRATMRRSEKKWKKDLKDARNYWLMMGAHLDALEGK